AEAERLGVELRGARTTMSQTAAGTVPAALVTLARLRVGAVELANVSALVTPAPLPYVLLGNSALERFRMQRDNDVLRLELR
ncbi:MAG: TIGR02281 family clan AA aspartic protease, partial [Comamonadaceae bacterium]|nr:TIGR02281 family clan AA aspartic protease [Comamonadaceae bacterium]